MARESTTLNVGDTAPNFLLTAANHHLAYQLSTALEEGSSVVVEFLRGTW